MDTERKESAETLAKQKQQAAAELEEARRPKFQHRSEVMSSGSITLPAGTVKAFDITVDSSTMQNIQLSGHFRAEGGVGSDIQVLVFDHDSYINWSTGHTTEKIFDSQLKTEGDVNASFSKSGKYYVVVSNKNASFWARTVDTNLRLDYDKRVF